MKGRKEKKIVGEIFFELQKEKNKLIRPLRIGEIQTVSEVSLISAIEIVQSFLLNKYPIDLERYARVNKPTLIKERGRVEKECIKRYHERKAFEEHERLIAFQRGYDRGYQNGLALRKLEDKLEKEGYGEITD